SFFTQHNPRHPDSTLFPYTTLFRSYLSLGIPFGPEFVFFDSNKLIPIFLGAVLGLGLNEAAYMSEIVRAGILSVDTGQTEAKHRSEEHTSELQSLAYLVCRLLLEKK